METTSPIALLPAATGLSMTVWARTSGLTAHLPQLIINSVHGDADHAEFRAMMSIQDLSVLGGQLAPADRDRVRLWIDANCAALMAYWDGAIDAATLRAGLCILAPDASVNCVLARGL